MSQNRRWRHLFGSYGFSAQKTLEAKYNNLEIAQAEYVKNHPENIYIKHTYTTIDVSPWAERPINLMDWGKPDYGSFAQRAKLHANGIESLCGDVMKKSNVFFLSETDFSLYVGGKIPTNDRTTHLYNYLRENYGATGIRLVDKVCDNIFVYQFVFDNSEEKLEKLYDIQEYVVRRKDFF